MKYKSKNAHVEIKYIDSSTEEILYEINNKTIMDCGDLLSEHMVTSMLKGKKNPKKLMVMILREYDLVD